MRRRRTRVRAQTANGDVERRLDGPAARAQQERERLVHIVNQNIGFRADVQVANKLRVGVRAQLTEAGRSCVEVRFRRRSQFPKFRSLQKAR